MEIKIPYLKKAYENWKKAGLVENSPEHEAYREAASRAMKEYGAKRDE